MGAAILDSTTAAADRGVAGGGRGGARRADAPPPPGSRSWCGPGRHGCRTPASEASRPAGAAGLAVCWAGGLWLRRQPLPPRRYPRARAVKAGGMGPKGPLHLSGHHVGEVTAPRPLTGLEQTSVASRVCATMTPGCRGHPRAWEPKDNRARVLTLALRHPLGRGATLLTPLGGGARQSLGGQSPSSAANDRSIGKTLNRFLHPYN